MSNRRKGSLAIGVTLIVIGILCVVIPSSQVFVGLLVHFWPMLLILFGAFRVFGFLRNGCPRSPIGGTLLVGIGCLFLVSSFTHNSAFQAYGRFWPFLLLAFGLGELIFQYSRRGAGMIAPPVITVGKLCVVVSLIATGVISSRIAKTNPNFLSASMPAAFSEFRDAIFGKQFGFSDAPQEFPFTSNSKISINNSYGDVEVRAASGSSMSISLNKFVRAYDQASAADINSKVKLQVNKSDGGYTITTNRDEVRSNIQTNLIITIPKNVALQIENRYGHVTLSGLVGDQSINNGHGSVDISDIRGQVKIEDSFGSTTVRRVAGLDVDTSHGSVDASDIAGDVTINSRYDNISIRNVDGTAKINGSQGSIKLASIKGSVVVEAEHSDIDGQTLQADAKISSSHCTITLAGISGDTLIAAPHANMDISAIGGGLTIEDSEHGRVNVRRVAKQLNITASHTEVKAASIYGPVSIQTSHAKVEVDNFFDTLKCSTSFERVTLSPSFNLKLSLNDIDVDNDRGEIRLNIPKGAQFQINASANHGRVVTSGLPLTPVSDKQYLSGSIGLGGAQVRLSTSYANVVIAGTAESAAPYADSNQ